MKGKIHIGTSGWHYDSWKGPFYDADAPDSSLLARYSAEFETVELNNSFYQLPKKDSVRSWKNGTPDRFLFSVKASRYLTHMKKLKDPEEGLSNFLEPITSFGPKLGPVLFQLPPRWNRNTSRLREFLEALPRDRRFVFEFRDKSWHHEETYELLEDFGAALCLYDLKKYRSPERVTADLVYIRLHGPSEQAYQGSYDGRTLAGYARKILRWNSEGRDVFCYFDNDEKSNAPLDARRLKESLEKQQ